MPEPMSPAEPAAVRRGSGIFVTVRDSVTGHEETTEIPADDYVLLCVGRCYRHSVQAYANGTHVITVQGRRGL
jgi:hypothetical protein